MINMCPYCGKETKQSKFSDLKTFYSKSKNLYYTCFTQRTLCTECNNSYLSLDDFDNLNETYKNAINTQEGFLIGTFVYPLINIYDITAEELSLVLDWDIKQVGLMPKSLKRLVDLFKTDIELFYFIIKLRKDKLSKESFERIERKIKLYLSGKISLYSDDDFDY